MYYALSENKEILFDSAMTIESQPSYHPNGMPLDIHECALARTCPSYVMHCCYLTSHEEGVKRTMASDVSAPDLPGRYSQRITAAAFRNT